MKIISVQMSFKIHFRCGNPPLCSGVIAFPSGPKSHTFTVFLAVFAPCQNGVINREKSVMEEITSSSGKLYEAARRW